MPSRPMAVTESFSRPPAGSSGVSAGRTGSICSSPGWRSCSCPANWRARLCTASSFEGAFGTVKRRDRQFAAPARTGPPGEDLTAEYWHSTGHEARSSPGGRHTSRTSATAGPQDDRAAPSSTSMCPGGTRRQRTPSATHHRPGSRHTGGQARTGGHGRSPGRPVRHREQPRSSDNYKTYIRVKPGQQLTAGADRAVGPSDSWRIPTQAGGSATRIFAAAAEAVSGSPPGQVHARKVRDFCGVRSGAVCWGTRGR